MERKPSVIRGLFGFLGGYVGGKLMDRIIAFFFQANAPAPRTAQLRPEHWYQTVISAPLWVILLAVFTGLVAAFWPSIVEYALDAEYRAEGLFFPRTFKGETSRLVRELRALVASVKACANRDDGVMLLMKPAAIEIIDHAHEVKVRLRNVLHSPTATRELTALENWPDDALAHMADVFDRLVTEVDPTLLAAPRPPRIRKA